MNRQLVLLFMIWLLPFTTGAAPVTRQQARRQAQQFMTDKGLTLSEQAVRHAPKKSKGSQPSDDAYYYVFHAADDKGFVVVSGDDRTAPVLGYCDRGELDENHMPEGLQWLLQMYCDQMDRLPASTTAPSEEPSKVKAAATARRHIEPLMRTLWNQGHPYNLLCPRYYNDDGTEGDRSATGCVATAIAQVMAYYRYPSATKRLIPGYVQKYQTTEGEKRVQLRNIPAGSVIDWENMLNNYHGDETDAQQQAIAELMYWVGMGCKMGYGPSSAAGFPEGVNALVNYFGYDDGTHIESRGNYTIAGWNELLYKELATGHPIAFAGTNMGGAHAFVLDGYDMDGLFHVNWGWGGLDNGYFRLDVLAPDDNSGIGASLTPDGYNMGQDAIIGMRLPDDEQAPAKTYQLTVNDWEIRNGNTFFGNYINWSGVSADWNTGIGYLNEEGSMVLVGSYQTAQLSQDFYVGHEFTVRGLKEGTYHIVPVSKRTTDRVWQTQVNPDIRYVLAVVDADGHVSLEIHPIEDVAMTSMSFPGNHKKDDRQEVCAVFKNNNSSEEYFHEVHLFASRTAEKGNSRGRTAVSIAAGGETTATFLFTPQETGTWNVWLATDYQGNDVVGQGTVEITSDGEPARANLQYATHKVSNRSNGVVYGDKMQGSVTILNNASEPFDGNVRLWLFKEGDDGMYYGAASIYVPMHIEARKSAQATYFFDHLDLDATYKMSILYAGGGDIQNGGLLTMGTTRKGIVYWQQNKTLGGMAMSSVVATPTNAVAIEMCGHGSSITEVRPNGNPNTLYLFGEGDTCPDGLQDANVVIGQQAQRITLTDGYNFLAPVSFTAAEISYTRKAEKDEWQTIALPFAPAALPTGVSVQTFVRTDDSQRVVFGKADTMERGIPYLMKSAVGGETTFTATDAVVSSSVDVPMCVGTDEYRFCGTTLRERKADIFVWKATLETFEASPAQAQIDPFRAYFTAPVSVGSVTPVLDTETGIDRTPSAAERNDGTLYDLQGRRIYTPRRGIYIRNGKKIAIW